MAFGMNDILLMFPGGLPVILCGIDVSGSSITNKYYYADGQILKQDSVAQSPPAVDKYFYIHGWVARAGEECP
jgi:hypothetical protein